MWRKKYKKVGLKDALIILLIVVISLIWATRPLANSLKYTYEKGESIMTKDRHGKIIGIAPNHRGHYRRLIEKVPERFQEILFRKEDRFFFYHLGINPISIFRDLKNYLSGNPLQGSSTITQQLVKILLQNEEKRTLGNKLKELVYAISLELHTSKEEILKMYVNSAYFGNQAEGVEEASNFYFSKPVHTLNDREILEMLLTLNNPSKRHPRTVSNIKAVQRLGALLKIDLGNEAPLTEAVPTQTRKSKTAFELNSLGLECKTSCITTLDLELNELLREILKRNLSLPSFSSVENGAVVVIKLPENELLAIIGSPDPAYSHSGHQINMATQPRSVGSTVKPFIYLKAFEKGARPYSVVEDREYKYEIGTGFSFYPKNYDGKYRGEVTLHQALSNSLNVPSVKVLEFVTLEKFYQFLRESLGFKSIQPLENYELGIALGSLEMDLLTLSSFFTVFPNEGVFKPLFITKGPSPIILTPLLTPELKQEKKIAEKEFIQLVNKILSDRETSVEQFGIKSTLTLEAKNYALKTGTSKDYKDSWTIGYTPDFLVGVWLGNSDNKPMQQLSGQSGAGKIWNEAMNLLLNSAYNKKTPFNFDSIKEFQNSGSLEYGLAGDIYEKQKLILKKEDTRLILHPHQNDTFLWEKNTIINLVGNKELNWYVNPVKNGISNGANNNFLGQGKEMKWSPQKTGKYIVRATDGPKEEVIQIEMVAEE